MFWMFGFSGCLNGFLDVGSYGFLNYSTWELWVAGFLDCLEFLDALMDFCVSGCYGFGKFMDC